MNPTTNIIDSKGEKVRIKAHGGMLEVHGTTVATVNDKLQLQSVEIWFDPMQLFRTIAKDHIAEIKTGSENSGTKDIDPVATAFRHMTPSLCPVMSRNARTNGNV